MKPVTRHQASALLALILLVTFGIHAPSLANTFAMDDRFLAKAVHDNGRPNPMVSELQSPGRYFTSHYWEGAAAPDIQYRPVTILSYALVYHTVGKHGTGESGEALPQHLVNVGLHLMAVWLVYRLLRRLVKHRGPPLLAALVFGVHAIHSEAVAGIVGRADLFAFCFGAAAVVLHGRAREAAGRSRGLHLISAGILLFLAFGSKENALAWPVFMAVFETARILIKQPATRIASALAAPLPTVGLVSLLPAAILVALWRWAVAGLAIPPVSPLANPLVDLPAPDRVFTAVQVWFHGLTRTLVPVDLACDHGAHVFQTITSALDLRFLAAATCLAAVGAGGLLAIRRHPLLFLAGTTFLGFSLVTANLLLLIGTLFGERLYYIPSLGLSFLVAWLATRRVVRWAGLAALLPWLCISGVNTFERCSVWKDDETLFLHDVKVRPESARLQYLAAKVHERRGEIRRMAAHLHRALEIHEDYALAWNDVGVLHARDGNLEKAESCFRRGLGCRDASDSDRFQLHTNLGVLLAQTRRPAEARKHLLLGLQRDPEAMRDRLRDLMAPLGRLLGDETIRRLQEEGKRQLPGDPARSRAK